MTIDVMDDAALRAAWDALPGNAKDVLKQLCVNGPVWDGDLISKAGRDELLNRRFAAKVIMGKMWTGPDGGKPRKQPECSWGFQAATYLGCHVYKQGCVEPRKESVRTLLGSDLQGFVKP